MDSYLPTALDRIERDALRGVENLFATAWPFIENDDTGRPTIPAKGLKVLQIVREHLTFDWDAEQLHRQHPQLCLAEIHAALGYYYEHRAECDTMLHRDEQRLLVLKHNVLNSELQERLRLARDKA